MHAAGVVIADQPLENFVPLYKAGDDLLTQFEGPIVEKVGLLKMDVLGLRTLTTLQRSIDLVKKTKGSTSISKKSISLIKPSWTSFAAAKPKASSSLNPA